MPLDLPGTAVALESRRIDVKSGGIDSIVAAEASGRTRVVFNLDALQPYSTRTDGNNVYVSLGVAGNTVAPATVTTASAGSVATGTYSIDKVDFRRGTDGAGRIMIRRRRRSPMRRRPSHGRDTAPGCAACAPPFPAPWPG